MTRPQGRASRCWLSTAPTIACVPPFRVVIQIQLMLLEHGPLLGHTQDGRCRGVRVKRQEDADAHDRARRRVKKAMYLLQQRVENGLLSGVEEVQVCLVNRRHDAVAHVRVQHQLQRRPALQYLSNTCDPAAIRTAQDRTGQSVRVVTARSAAVEDETRSRKTLCRC